MKRVAHKIIQNGEEILLDGKNIAIGNKLLPSVLEENKGWERVDLLSDVVEVTSTDYANPTIIPLSRNYADENGVIYAIDLSPNPDFRGSQIIFFRHSTTGSAGRLMIAPAAGTDIIFVNRIRVANSPKALGLYDATSQIYVRAVYVVKEVL